MMYPVGEVWDKEGYGVEDRLDDILKFARSTVGKPNPQSECQNADQCPGTGVYCYPKGQFRVCIKGDGIGSICENDEQCGYIGSVQLICEPQYQRRMGGMGAPVPGLCKEP